MPAHNTGGGEKADIPFEQPVNGNFPPLIGKNIRPKLSRTDERKTQTICRSAVDDRPSLNVLADGRPRKRRPLLRRKLFPHRKISRNIHFRRTS